MGLKNNNPKWVTHVSGDVTSTAVWLIRFLSQVPAISNGRVVALHVEPIKAVQ